jgi:hypothetical protein
MSKAATVPTVADLQSQRDGLVARRHAADEVHNSALGHRSRVRGMAALGRVDANEVQAADAAVDRAAQESSDLGDALAIIGTELEAAETAAEEQRRLDLRRDSEQAAGRRTAAKDRLRKGVGALDGALEAWDNANASIAANATSLREANEEAVAEIEASYVAGVATAEKAFSKAYEAAEMNGATLLSESRSSSAGDLDRRPASGMETWGVNPELRAEARQHAEQERDAGIAAVASSRDHALAALGLGLAAEADEALQRAASDYVAILSRINPKVPALRAALIEACDIARGGFFAHPTGELLRERQERVDQLREVAAA